MARGERGGLASVFVFVCQWSGDQLLFVPLRRTPRKLQRGARISISFLSTCLTSLHVKAKLLSRCLLRHR
jgi:hypothetical protein